MHGWQVCSSGWADICRIYLLPVSTCRVTWPSLAGSTAGPECMHMVTTCRPRFSVCMCPHDSMVLYICSHHLCPAAYIYLESYADAAAAGPLGQVEDDLHCPSPALSRTLLHNFEMPLVMMPDYLSASHERLSDQQFHSNSTKTTAQLGIPAVRSAVTFNHIRLMSVGHCSDAAASSPFHSPTRMQQHFVLPLLSPPMQTLVVHIK